MIDLALFDLDAVERAWRENCRARSDRLYRAIVALRKAGHRVYRRHGCHDVDGLPMNDDMLLIAAEGAKVRQQAQGFTPLERKRVHRATMAPARYAAYIDAATKRAQRRRERLRG